MKIWWNAIWRMTVYGGLYGGILGALYGMALIILIGGIDGIVYGAFYGAYFGGGTGLVTGLFIGIVLAFKATIFDKTIDRKSTNFLTGCLSAFGTFLILGLIIQLGPYSIIPSIIAIFASIRASNKFVDWFENQDFSEKGKKKKRPNPSFYEKSKNYGELA